MLYSTNPGPLGETVRRLTGSHPSIRSTRPSERPSTLPRSTHPSIHPSISYYTHPSEKTATCVYEYVPLVHSHQNLSCSPGTFCRIQVVMPPLLCVQPATCRLYRVVTMFLPPYVSLVTRSRPLGHLAEVRGPRVEKRARDGSAQGHQDGGAGTAAALALSTHGNYR